MARQGWTYISRIGLLGVVVLSVLGCAHHISESMRQQADKTLTFVQLRTDPEAYQDRTVILGGEILQTRNVQEGTRLEILQKPLDHYEQPRLTDLTQGRFIANCEGYLDPAIYKRGREITIAGRVVGAQKGRVGEVDYTYPLISCLEIYLWPEPVQPLPYKPYPWGYWGSPWIWRPYYSPWIWRPYYYPW